MRYESMPYSPRNRRNCSDKTNCAERRSGLAVRDQLNSAQPNLDSKNSSLDLFKCLMNSPNEPNFNEVLRHCST
jgi:hypothetical protein